MTGGPPYRAVDVARRMVEISIDKELWLTNLKLQKVLYFTWMQYFRDHGIRLFDDRQFEAWKYGPVVSDVYYEYWLNVANLIFLTAPPDAPIDDDTSAYLESKLREYKDMSASQLVKMTHEEGGLWEKSFSQGDKTPIPFQDMERVARPDSAN